MLNNNYSGGNLRHSWNANSYGIDSHPGSRRFNNSVFNGFNDENKFVQYSNVGIIDLHNFEGFEKIK